VHINPFAPQKKKTYNTTNQPADDWPQPLNQKNVLFVLSAT
jgi:hypothetical protein